MRYIDIRDNRLILEDEEERGVGDDLYIGEKLYKIVKDKGDFFLVKEEELRQVIVKYKEEGEVKEERLLWIKKGENLERLFKIEWGEVKEKKIEIDFKRKELLEIELEVKTEKREDKLKKKENWIRNFLRR